MRNKRSASASALGPTKLQTSSLPSEVWATVFDYAGQGEGPLQPDQISRFRLLSRSITAGLDEWILRGMDEGVKRDGRLRLARVDPNGLLPPVQPKKLALLALSK
jgi:hypothetical protein